jgi:hypothetical protein
MEAADPSLATKEEETRRLENIIYDCGKAAKLLLDGSHQHEVRCTSPPPPHNSLRTTMLTVGAGPCPALCRNW